MLFGLNDKGREKQDSTLSFWNKRKSGECASGSGGEELESEENN